MIRAIDSISDFTGRLAAWMFFAIGLFVTYEVIMRYVFTAPTIWVDEVSRIMQIWATYLAGAFALRHRKMIVIEVFFKDHESLGRRLSESFGLAMIMLFCLVACWYGFDQWLEKTLKNDHTDTLLGLPKWLTLSSIWVGFGLLLLQSLAELARIWTQGVPPSDHSPDRV